MFHPEKGILLVLTKRTMKEKNRQTFTYEFIFMVINEVLQQSPNS